MDQNLEQSFPFNPFVAFIAFAAFLVISHFIKKKLRDKKLRQQGQVLSPGASSVSIEQRVANNKNWASGAIPSRGPGVMYALWVVAIGWNLVTTIPFFQSLALPTATGTQRIVLGFLALIGVVIIAFTVRATIRWYRYGRSLCCIDGKAGVLGKSMTGKIRTERKIETEGDFTIKIQCAESYSTGSGKNRTSHTDIRWEQEHTVPHGGKNSNLGIPFSFTLPANAMETADISSRGDVDWKIQIHAPTKGVDYAATFVVPVFKMN